MLYIDTVATEKREEGKRASRRNKINESFFFGTMKFIVMRGRAGKKFS